MLTCCLTLWAGLYLAVVTTFVAQTCSRRGLCCHANATAFLVGPPSTCHCQRCFSRRHCPLPTEFQRRLCACYHGRRDERAPVYQLVLSLGCRNSCKVLYRVTNTSCISRLHIEGRCLKTVISHELGFTTTGKAVPIPHTVEELAIQTTGKERGRRWKNWAVT